MRTGQPQGTVYTYAQLEGLWINAGGPKAVAPIAAAIALAESSGVASVVNSIGACGLWQIHPYQNGCTNAQNNAKMAVAKYKGAGNSFSPWVTYENGAYKGFLNTKTTPVGVKPGSGNSTGAAASNTNTSGCLFVVPNPVTSTASSIPIVNLFVGSTTICLFRKTEARAFLGGLIMAVGGVTGFVGLAVLVASAFGHTKAGQGAGKAVGTAGEVAGAAISVAGAPEVGAGVAAAGFGLKSGAKHTQQRRQSRVTDDRRMQRQLGEPRENPGLRVGRGAIRETPQETRRRSITPGGRPASRSETGF